MEDSERYGISIGHHDTHNLIRKNTVRRSGQAGVLFRAEREADFAPHWNRLEENRIEDSGPADGVAIDVQGETQSVTIARNQITETRGPEKRIGIRLGAKTRDIRLEENQITGVAVPVADLRTA